jgi:hypothetical protein
MDRGKYGLALWTGRGYFRSVQMHYFPACVRLRQYDRWSIEQSGPVVQMESRNRTIGEHLHLHVLWLNVHIRRCRFAAANLLEHNPESLLKFGASVRAFRKCFFDPRTQGEATRLTERAFCGHSLWTAGLLSALAPIEGYSGTSA